MNYPQINNTGDIPNRLWQFYCLDLLGIFRVERCVRDGKGSGGCKTYS